MSAAQQKRLPKFRRQPDAFRGTRITERSIRIIELVLRCPFLPTSLIIRLIGRDTSTTHIHLKRLYHMGYISRFAFPKITGPIGEFHYFIASGTALQLLETADLPVRPYDYEVVKNFREKGYGTLDESGDATERVGKLLFLKHGCMISRFQAMLRLACMASAGRVQLLRWEQGALVNDTVEIDAESGKERIPHRPDAFFTLRFSDRLEGQNESHFFYEADRGTMGAERIKQKMRGYMHYVVKQNLHVKKYGVQRIRAVLFEAIDARTANRLSKVAQHPSVCGGRPTQLFWFTPGDLLTKVVTDATGRNMPVYLARPEAILDPRWATAQQDRLLSLLD